MSSRVFAVPRAPYDEGHNLYAHGKFEISTGVTILVGCNGSGKSTLMRLIKEDLRKNSINYIEFNNLTDGRMMKSKLTIQGRMGFVAQALCSSEGEEIMLNICEVVSEIGSYVSRLPANGELWVFFDAVDSGISIDNALDIKDFFRVLQENNSDRDVYIVVSANAYEFASGEDCLDVCSAKHVQFKTYDAYKSFIMKSRKAKDKRNERWYS